MPAIPSEFAQAARYASGERRTANLDIVVATFRRAYESYVSSHDGRIDDTLIQMLDQFAQEAAKRMDEEDRTEFLTRVAEA